MNEGKVEILIRNAREYFSDGEYTLEKGSYNSALVLFFKSLVSLIDLYILNQTGNTPSSHTARFSIVRDKFPEVYDILDKDFPFYQNSYVQNISKELTEVVKEDAKLMAEKVEVKL